ncbi:MAG: 3-keto-5-aminohexanoate cleavage protein [Pseudomonadota bacterium]
MIALPRIMVAPNGARLTKADHSAVPTTISEIVQTAKDCWEAGAGGLHAHVRNRDQQHVLDAGLYRELSAEMRRQLPDMLVQITTEAVGRYTAEQQCQLVKDVRPPAVSIALRELVPGLSQKTVRSFYHWAYDAGVAVQHILYDRGDIQRLAHLVEIGQIPKDGVQVLVVLGRYSPDHVSVPDDLTPLLEVLKHGCAQADWAVCAFGRNETACLRYAADQGGKMRIGFENNTAQADGTIAPNNAARVDELISALVG